MLVVMPQKWKPINGLKMLSTAKINVLNIIPKKIALNERLLNAALNSRITCFGETDGAGAYDFANSLGSCDRVPAAQIQIATTIMMAENNDKAA